MKTFGSRPLFFFLKIFYVLALEVRGWLLSWAFLDNVPIFQNPGKIGVLDLKFLVERGP